MSHSSKGKEGNNWDCFIFLVTGQREDTCHQRIWECFPDWLSYFSFSCGPTLPRHRAWWLCYRWQRCCHQVQHPQLCVWLPLCDCLGDLWGIRVPVQNSVWYKLSLLHTLSSDSWDWLSSSTFLLVNSVKGRCHVRILSSYIEFFLLRETRLWLRCCPSVCLMFYLAMIFF